MERWISKYGNENVSIIILEELKQDPKKHLKELSSKLGIDSDYWDTYSFDVKNKTVNISNMKVHKKMMGFSNLIPSFIKKSRLKDIYYRINSSKVVVKEDNSNRLKRLDEEFKPEVAKLEKLLGRKINVWS